MSETRNSQGHAKSKILEALKSAEFPAWLRNRNIAPGVMDLSVGIRPNMSSEIILLMAS